ncbi:DNA ligase (ATP) [Desmophyllum pertusum]|uniref:DNA ligase (ATP) n=1 Tax=Desmophyllum pertusum TaxID=174260 RepID=A0A9X0CYE1_9CNID|nr:DNA ligase (ATP) [Desmophyllum pertusum]
MITMVIATHRMLQLSPSGKCSKMSKRRTLQFLYRTDEMLEIEQRYFPSTSTLGLFKHCRVYLDQFTRIGDTSMAIPKQQSGTCQFEASHVWCPGL